MLLYRLTHPKYAQDLSGTGAKLYGARWNSKGIPILYTAPDPATCMVEFMVHIAHPKFFPNHQVLVEIEIPDALATIKRVTRRVLPSGWDRTPGPLQLKSYGDQFVKRKQELLLSVPSVPVPKARNYLINPWHPHFNHVTVKNITAYPFEPRLMKIIQGS